MSMLDSFFSKGFKVAKCKTLLKLTIPRIKLLRNRREAQIKQMRRDIAKLLETGQEATARIRVEHIIREEKMMAAQEILELFCELIAVRLPIIEAQRECPLDLKEAIASVCFAAPRCADLPELQQVQILFASKYGKEFVSAATELRPDCGVNRQLVELLSVRAPSPEAKLKLLKDIAEEHELDWDPAGTETEFFKPHEDLLDGPRKFGCGTKLPLPKEKHDEALYSSPDLAHNEQPDADSDFDELDFPEVPKAPLRPSANASPNPALGPASAATTASMHQDIDLETLSCSASSNLSEKSHLDSKDVLQESLVPKEDDIPTNLNGFSKEDKQFPPSFSTTSVAPETISAKQSNSPRDGPKTNTDANVDLQDVLSAAHAAAETAERAAAAARSAASLAQLRIAELTKKKDKQVIQNPCENPFHTSIREREETSPNRPHFDHQISSSSNSDYIPSHWRSNRNDGNHQGSDCQDVPALENLKLTHESPISAEQPHGQEPSGHQPQRLPSMEDDSYLSYPNLFSSQSPDHAPAAHSFTDNSRSTHDS